MTVPKAVVVGIDVGSLGLRAAWAGPDGAKDLAVPLHEPWVVAVLAAGRISFTSVKEQRSPAAVRSLVAALSAVRSAVCTESGVDVGRAVLTVPVRMDSRDRGALRDAARAAGFTEVHLINDSVAAVLGSADTGPRTVLVYSMGHSGFEVGLLRAARRQVRVLGHVAAESPSGNLFDHLVLNEWLNELGADELAALAEWDDERWTKHRYHAASVKEQLAAGTDVAGWPSAKAFSAVVTEVIGQTGERVSEVLSEADQLPRDIDSVLLVGGTAGLPAVSAMLTSALETECTRAEPSMLARGAAVYGVQLGDAPAPTFESEYIDAEPAERSALVVPTPPAPPDRMAEARTLWSEGKPKEAVALLTALIDEASALRDEITASVPATSDRARRALDRANRFLRKGKLNQAVSESHLAWQMDHDDAAVFKEMIDMHLRAAAASPGPDGYSDARHWLECANQHARFNEEVMTALFDRNLEQARHLHEQGRSAEAAELLEECRQVNPDHPGVVALSASL